MHKPALLPEQHRKKFGVNRSTCNNRRAEEKAIHKTKNSIFMNRDEHAKIREAENIICMALVVLTFIGAIIYLFGPK